MTTNEIMAWFGVSILSLLIIATAVVVVFSVVLAVISAVGWLYDRIIRWRVKHGRN